MMSAYSITSDSVEQLADGQLAVEDNSSLGRVAVRITRRQENSLPGKLAER